MKSAPFDTFQEAVAGMPLCLVGGYDALAHKTLEDLQFITMHELDLYGEGEIELSHRDLGEVVKYRNRLLNTLSARGARAMPIPTLPPARRVKAWDGAWFVIIGGVDLGLVERLPISKKWEAIVSRELCPSGCSRTTQRSLGKFDTMNEAVAELRIQFGQVAMDKYRADADEIDRAYRTIARTGGI